MPVCVPGTRTRTPKPRSASYHRVNARFGTLEMTVGEGEKAETFGYYVEDLAHDLGDGMRCFKLTKYRTQQTPDEPAEYDVAIDLQADGDRGQTSCECLGWLRWSHRTACKHVSSLLALIRAGRI